MKLTINKKLWFGFNIILILLIITGIAELWNINNMRKEYEFLLKHDLLVISNAEELRKLVVDMETGQRGFCITRKEEFLKPYLDGKKKFKELIKKEIKLVKDNPAQVKVLEKIEKLVEEWQEKAAQPEITLARRISHSKITSDYLQELLTKGIGKDILDRLRTTLDEMDLAFQKEGNIKGANLTKMIAKAIVKQEIGQREFLITGKDVFLQPYKEGIILFKKNLEKLRKLNSNAYDISLLNKNIDRLSDLNKEWQEKVAIPEIAARYKMKEHPESIDDVGDILMTGIGKSVMDKIREQFNSFISTEWKLTRFTSYQSG